MICPWAQRGQEKALPLEVDWIGELICFFSFLVYKIAFVLVYVTMCDDDTYLAKKGEKCLDKFDYKAALVHLCVRVAEFGSRKCGRKPRQEAKKRNLEK